MLRSNKAFTPLWWLMPTTSVSAARFEHLHQGDGGLVVKLVGGFVEEQDLRSGGEGAGEAEALLFAAGQAAVPFGFGIQIVFQTA